MSWRTRRSLCAPRLSRTTMSPGRSLGARPRPPTRRSGRHWPSASWCASSASDPLGSRRSSSSCPPNASAAGRPRRPPAGPTHATGPSPDSRPIHPQTRAARDLPPWPTGGTRRAWRGRRAGPVPRAADGFLKHVSRPPQRAQDTRPMDPVRQGHPPGVYARQFPGGGIRRVPDNRVHHLEHHG